MGAGMTPDTPPANELRPRVRSIFAAIAIGAASGVLGIAAARLVLLVDDDVTYAPLVGAVAVAIWLAGGPGGIAAVVSGWLVAAWALTDEGIGGPAGANLDVRWTVGLLFGIMVAGIGFGMRRDHERAADAAELAERSRLRVERLQMLATSLSAALTVEEVARAMIEEVPAAIGAHGGALGLVENGDLVIVDPRGAPGQTLRPGSRLPLTSRAPIVAAAREGEPVWAQRRQEFVTRFADGAALAPYASGALAVPVFVGERLAGAMGFPFTEPDSVTAEVRTVARIAADLGGQALERAALYEQERSSHEALDRILAVAPRFQHARTSEALVTSVCVEARKVFGCDVVQVWTPVEGEQLEVAWREPPTEVIPPGTRIDFADFPGLLDEMRALRSMFVPNAQEHTCGEALLHARRLGLFSSLRVPIVIDGQFERILALQWERVIPQPAPSVIAVARRFADQAGLALEQAARRRAQDETRALQAVSEALAAAATPEDVGLAIVRQGVRGLGARAAAVYAVTENGESLELIASEGQLDGMISGSARIPLAGANPLSDAVRGNAIVSCADPDEVQARYPAYGGTDTSFVAAPLVAGGRAIGAIFLASLERRGRDDDPSYVIDLARQAAQALDRAQLFERERAAAGRLRKLQDVTASLSQAVTIEDVSSVCLEHAAAGVGAPEGLVVLRRTGDERDPSTDAVIAAIGPAATGDEAPAGIPDAAAAPIAECVRSGRPVLSDAGGWIAFPLASGALAVRPSSGRRLADADRQWLVTLVSQGEQALDRASRYETERGIAETLQRSILPEQLPSVYGITVAARYLPGTVGVDVGGDWYDVIQLDGGRIGLVIGDVVGKGVQAAAMMGQLRNALRAFAFEHDDPRLVVSRLGRLTEGMVDAPFATLAYLVIDPRERRVQYVVAGHPPPLIRAADGTTSFLESGRSLPIGVDASLAFEAGEEQLDPGSTILLYTDGLVERRGTPLDEGLDRLAVAASSDAGDVEDLVESVISALVGLEDRPDDVAVLAVRFATAALPDLRLVLPTTQDGLVEMRRLLREWLSRGQVGAEEAAEAVLAVWEACANAVEHAQEPARSSFDLHAMLDDGGRIRFEVTDSGQWRAGGGTSGRGLGLGLMRSLMDSVEVIPSDAGTEVVMERLVRMSDDV